MWRGWHAIVAGAALLSACAQTPLQRDMHVPDFASVPYEPFSRDAAITIALREWRLFGQPVRDEPPGTRMTAEADIPMRQEGLWQRVGEYWWLGQDAGTAAARWTGRHDQHGQKFPADEDDRHAWSAAFISYVMRSAGAGRRFPYAIAHATYIDAAWRAALDAEADAVITAEPPERYAPQPGDLICTGRDAATSIRFADLPVLDFPSHCDIVVATAMDSIRVIGGNVGAAVAMKHVPVAADGRLVGPDGAILDPRYPWFVVLRVRYDR